MAIHIAYQFSNVLSNMPTFQAETLSEVDTPKQEKKKKTNEKLFARFVVVSAATILLLLLLVAVAHKTYHQLFISLL